MQGLGNKDGTLFLTGVDATDANKATGWSHIMNEENNDNIGANYQKTTLPNDVIAAQIVDLATQMANNMSH